MTKMTSSNTNHAICKLLKVLVESIARLQVKELFVGLYKMKMVNLAIWKLKQYTFLPVPLVS